MRNQDYALWMINKWLLSLLRRSMSLMVLGSYCLKRYLEHGLDVFVLKEVYILLFSVYLEKNNFLWLFRSIRKIKFSIGTSSLVLSINHIYGQKYAFPNLQLGIRSWLQQSVYHPIITLIVNRYNKSGKIAIVILLLGYINLYETLVWELPVEVWSALDKSVRLSYWVWTFRIYAFNHLLRMKKILHNWPKKDKPTYSLIAKNKTGRNWHLMMWENRQKLHSKWY